MICLGIYIFVAVELFIAGVVLMLAGFDDFWDFYKFGIIKIHGMLVGLPAAIIGLVALGEYINNRCPFGK